MNEHIEAIVESKRRMGEDLVILAHHYQRPEVVALGDFVGDSFVLSREAARSSATHIVFCGVYFMAEAARILAKKDQRVFMPDPRAGCPMADMADVDDARTALETLRDAAGPGRKVVPVTYINSNADVKALVGREGGIVCTSANAEKALAWAAEQGDVTFFLPDEFLGTNTALKMVQGPIVRWNPHEGGAPGEALKRAGVVVWTGYCHVHTFFTKETVAAARRKHPGCTVVVHPECKPEVVEAADGAGSTSYLVRKVEEAAPGETVVVGTEVSLVLRLAENFKDRKVIPLDYSLCPNMYRTTVAKLASVLHTFEPQHEITVQPDVVEGARLALDRMLSL